MPRTVRNEVIHGTKKHTVSGTPTTLAAMNMMIDVRPPPHALSQIGVKESGTIMST